MPRHPGSRITLAAVLSLALLPALAAAGALTDLLIAQVGVTQPQADGGAGSIFKLARAQMSPENFHKLRTVVPGLDGYLGAAPAFLPNESPAAGANPAAGQSVGLAGMAGGGSATSALAAAAMGQPLSPADALKGAARNKLSQSLGAAVPGAQGGMAGVAAGALGANAGGLPAAGGASALLAGTALGDKLQAAQALAPAFQQLGMNQGMVARFLPIVVDYVKSVGGKSSSKLLTHALGF